MKLSYPIAVAALAGASMLLDIAVATVSHGLIRSLSSGKCWQNFYAPNGDSNTYIRPRDCNTTEPTQLFEYDDTGDRQIIPVGLTNKCLDGNTNFTHLFVWTCISTAPNHKWSFLEGNANNEMPNGILKSDQLVCASTGTNPGDDKITWVPCNQVQEHFEFFKLDAAQISGAAVGTIAPVGTGVVLATNPPTRLPTSPPSSLPTSPPSSLPTSPPSSSPSSLPPPAVVSSCGGDPHCKTWSGKNFDFHGACDLVLIDHPGYDKGRGLTIHIRTKQEKWWSFIEAAAIRIGDQTLEVRGADVGEKAQFWINGVRGEDASSSDNPALKRLQEDMGVTIHYKRASEKQHKFRIDLDSAGDAISMGSYKKWVAVNVNTKRVQNFLGATGMMGQYPSGAMVARDGTTLMENDTDAYGNEWQVRASDSFLFSDVGDGVHYPEKCQMPDVASAQRRLGEFVMPLEVAEKACAHVDDGSFDPCVFDVLATNDKDMAGAY